jgi:hypothetical protein
VRLLAQRKSLKNACGAATATIHNAISIKPQATTNHEGKSRAATLFCSQNNQDDQACIIIESSQSLGSSPIVRYTRSTSYYNVCSLQHTLNNIIIIIAHHIII